MTTGDMIFMDTTTHTQTTAYKNAMTTESVGSRDNTLPTPIITTGMKTPLLVIQEPQTV
jgi:hypothetical protein